MEMEDEAMVLYGTSWCGDCRRTKRLLDDRGAAYGWVDVEADVAAAEEMLGLNGGVMRAPTLLLPSGAVLVEPSPRELEDWLERRAPRGTAPAQ